MEPRVLQELLDELLHTDQILVVLGGAGAVGELEVGATTVSYHGEQATVKSEGWHLHLSLGEVAGVQFVEADDHGHSIPKLYYVRFSDAGDETLIRFYFPNPWLDDEEKPTDFQPDRLRLFEEFRERYVQRDGIVAVHRSPRDTTAN